MPSHDTAPFREALNDYPDRLRSLTATGTGCVGYFCTYTPVEVIHAAGFLPIRIMGDKGPVEKAYSLAPDFICPYMKRSLEKALAGEYDFLSGIVQGYTCDVACGLINIWEENIGGSLFHSIPFPYKDSAESRIFFRAEIHRLVEHMNRAGGSFTPDALDRSMALYDEIRSLILNLYDRVFQNRMGLTATDFFTIVQAGGVLPPEVYRDMLLVVRENPLSEPAPPEGIPVLISGSMIESYHVIEAIEDMGGQVAGDDLCSGTRHLRPAKGEGKDAVDRIIDRHFKRSPCPSRSRATRRAEQVLALAEKYNAKGVIFLVQKFCTPHLSDYPVLADILKKKNFPCTLIEMDESWSVGGQFKTRVEGFLEVLESAGPNQGGDREDGKNGKNEKIQKTA